MAAPPARLLVVNGCEHTSAGEALGWPDHLAAELDVPLLNLAVPRASNRRIVRTTTARLVDEVLSRGLTPEDVLFVAMFTELDRVEVGIEPRRRRSRRSSADPWRTIDRGALRADDHQAQSWYAHLHHPVSDLVDLLLSVALLGCWLDRLRCRHVFALTEGWTVPPGAEAIARTYSDRIEPGWVLGGTLDAWPRTALLDSTGTTGAPAPPAVHRSWVDRLLVPYVREAGW